MILPCSSILKQVDLFKLIPLKTYETLDPETQKHKFDLVVSREKDVLVIEVNYKHGQKAARKWENIFTPHLKASTALGLKKIIPVAINDWDCESLFKHEKNSTKPIRITDILDVCNALKTAGVKFCQ